MQNNPTLGIMNDNYDFSVSKIMTRNPKTVQMEASLSQAYEMMREYHCRHLPVHDGQGRLVGVLSDRDISRAMNQQIDHHEIEISFDDDDRVKDFMSWPAVTIGSELSVSEAAKMMVDQKLSALVVIDGNHQSPDGIVTTDDMLRLIAGN